MSSTVRQRYDAVIVPGGGLNDRGQMHPFVEKRLEAALRVDPPPKWFIVLSRGTTHRVPPMDAAGRPIDEATVSANYLISNGAQPTSVLKECWSLDTIGNAYFARYMIVDNLDLRRLLIITSDFHMERTKAIFRWVFDMRPTKLFDLDFHSVSDDGLLSSEALALRREKEAQGLISLQKTMQRVQGPSELAKFLFVEHGAYKSDQNPPEQKTINSELQKTY
eukprot:CAMPEP_0113954346 /NCGR_PEP_ID=MMETSP0011_2-20120614/473_1 /TAXON_ID=101924 /ORGANISM="Rhodosorus marinus" /LENGTH=220 /DNA_ID=CAMNT_0000963407 /DNA_START=316 /DNA_END=978 /DNA_ORIENTATION=- /assembly_acc=CAM_ASM_000156